MQSSVAFQGVVGLRLASRAGSPVGLSPQYGYLSISEILGRRSQKNRAMVCHPGSNFLHVCHEVPLAVHLIDPAQRKLTESEHRFDDAEQLLRPRVFTRPRKEASVLSKGDYFDKQTPEPVD